MCHAEEKMDKANQNEQAVPVASGTRAYLWEEILAALAHDQQQM